MYIYPFSPGPPSHTPISPIKVITEHLAEFPVLYHTYSESEVTQSCPTLCDPIDGSPPGFPIPRILQASTLEWVAISFSNA